MSHDVDFKSVASNALARAHSLVPSLLPDGSREGSAEWSARNPRRADQQLGSFKVNMNTGLWSDFSSGDGGNDLISLVAYIHGSTQLEAAKWLTGSSPEDGKPLEKREVKKAESFTAIIPAPANKAGALETMHHSKHGKPSAFWIYKTIDGEPINAVCRFDTQEGKEICPFTYGVKDEKEGWHWKQIPDNRPLYGLERIGEKNTVLFAEGEKAADALHGLTKQPALAWPGGSKAWKKADFSPIAGKTVYLFSDADEPGRAAMPDVAAHLLKLGCKVKLALIPDQEGYKGWDAANALQDGWTGKQFYEFVTPFIKDYPPEQQLPEAQKEQPAKAPTSTLPESSPEYYYDRTEMRGQDIVPLGYDHGTYYLYSSLEKQVCSYSPSQLTEAHLQQLADLRYWENQYPAKSGVNWSEARSAVMRMCQSKGIYDPDRIRGRGAWMEGDTPIMHLGDVLLVGGEARSLSEHHSRFVYERSINIPFDETEPALTAKECTAFMELCRGIRWEHDLMAYYLAGWCVIAPFCGALSWRPHVWISGPAGSGKSWLLENIVEASIGKFSISMQHNTSEAGIRQKLGSDAMPIVFDEIKGEDKGEAEKIQGVLGLMRAASTNKKKGDGILKGSQDGKAREYKIRSCFLLASVGVSIKQHADEGRISVLSVRAPSADIEEKEKDAENFRHLEELAIQMTDDYIQRLHNRTFALLPIIRKNAKTFSLAARRVLGTQRDGDQAGILLAGAYSLHSGKEVDIATAEEWVRRNNVAATATESEPDHMRCAKHLIQSRLRIPTRERIMQDISIGELVEICRKPDWLIDEENMVDGVYTAPEITKRAAEQNLNRNGIRVIDDMLVVANDHAGVAAIYRNTAWSVGWARTLKQNSYASNYHNRAVSFLGGVTSKVTCTPLPALEHTRMHQERLL